MKPVTTDMIHAILKVEVGVLLGSCNMSCVDYGFSSDSYAVRVFFELVSLGCICARGIENSQLSFSRSHSIIDSDMLLVKVGDISTLTDPSMVDQLM